MQATIDRLLLLLNKYPVETINKIYNEKEVELEIQSFTKHPEVRWSDSLKKKMIRQAKQKKISLKRQEYLEELIRDINNFSYDTYLDLAIADIINLLDKIEIRM